MKKLYLIRHAKSDWSHAGLRDIDRPLNERGHKDAPRMAKLLRGMGVTPDLIVSSPANRARTTAEYFAKEFDYAPNKIDIQKDIYEADIRDIMLVVHDLPDAADTVFLYGHNPTFTYFANRFTDKIIDNIPTCGVVKIEAQIDNWSTFESKNARVTGFWFPKEIND
jgi:phosphohistidine phosphatase